MPIKRAYGSDDKEERRAAILAAAAALYGDGSGDLPTVGRIADRAGLAKGTVYLYFRSKEAIFIALLLDGWGAVFDLVDAVFKSTDGDPAALFLDAYVDHLDRHRALLQLDARRPALEFGLDANARTEFKRVFFDRLDSGGSLLERRLGLAEGGGVKLLTRTHALTCGLWQSLGSMGQASEHEAADPFGAKYPSFTQELAEALAEFWRGALSH